MPAHNSPKSVLQQPLDAKSKMEGGNAGKQLLQCVVVMANPMESPQRRYFTL